MKFYIMHRGFFQEISAKDRKHYATFFVANDRRNLRRVKFFCGKYAGDTKLNRLEKLLTNFSGKLRIKVGGPAVFIGRPIGVEKIGEDNWSSKGDYYLKTEITIDRLYCYSWIANSSDKNPICMSFEIMKETLRLIRQAHNRQAQGKKKK